MGTTLVTHEMSLQEGGMVNWIQSVFVMPSARGNGCFRSIFEHIVQDAREDPNVVCVRLYVETANETAKTVYNKLGMTCLDSLEFVERDFVFSHH